MPAIIICLIKGTYTCEHTQKLMLMGKQLKL